MVRLSPSEEDALQGMPPKFDMKAARKLCSNPSNLRIEYSDRISMEKDVYESLAARANTLPAALDEIVRWKKIALPVALDEIVQWKEIALRQAKRSVGFKQAARRHRGTIDAQAKRIAELDDDAQRLHDRKEEFAVELVKANHRIAELEELDQCLNCGRHLFSSDPVLGKDSVYRLGAIFFDPGSPGGREEPPEPACTIPICQDCLEDLEKADLLKEKIAKQRAALKVLGQRAGRRGKALVEERARKIAESRTGDFVNAKGDHMYREVSPKSCMAKARQQLRHEGLL